MASLVVLLNIGRPPDVGDVWTRDTPVGNAASRRRGTTVSLGAGEVVRALYTVGMGGVTEGCLEAVTSTLVGPARIREGF